MIAIQRRHRTAVRNSVVFAAIAAVAVVLVVPAKAYEVQQMRTNPSGQVEFIMPSGNIGCIYTPEGGMAVYETWDGLAEIQCDRVEPNYVRAILGGQGEGEIYDNVGDAGCCGAPQKFRYDHIVVLGPFQCLSTTKGLTCARADGHGFFLSLALVQAK